MPFDRTTPPTRVDLLVPGLTCAGCMRRVERCLAVVEGVASVRANLSLHRVTAEVDPALSDADALVAALGAEGFDARPFDASIGGSDQADRTGRDLLLRLGVAGFAAMNVMLLSVSVWSGAEAATRDMMHWISALIALPAISYSGMPFFRGALGALAARRLNMDVPISLAICLAAGNSLFTTASGGEHAYFDAGIMLIFFLLIGRYLDHRTRATARSAAAELNAMTGRTAQRRMPDGSRQLCPVDRLATGMLLEVMPGERIPADGVIDEGATDLDRSLITGESRPEPAAAGAEVHAGMLNLTGPVTMRVTATGDATLLAEIARMVDAAGRGRGRYDRLADRAARIYAPGVHLLALAAFLGWFWLAGNWQLALDTAVAVLIITCPCALALAVPTVHTVASGRLFRDGIFLKDGAELERLAEVDMVAFDKTGTLTDGAPRVVSGPPDAGRGWPVAMALAAGSRHPLSGALHRAAEERGVAAAAVSGIREFPGLGIEGRCNGQLVRLGRPEWIGDAADGADVAVRADDGTVGSFAFEERLRPGATETCAGLRSRGIELAILSGDGAAAVGRIAGAAGIERRHAALMPGDKVGLLGRWQSEGRRVLMVGDGLNDSPALAAAHASMSPSSAADASRIAAGLVFTGARLDAVLTAIDVARTARRRSLQSFGFAAAYNAVAIPLAIAGLVTPLIAALAMSGSSVVVVLNALRLRGRR